MSRPNYLTPAPVGNSGPRGEFPPQYLNCPREGCGGVLIGCEFMTALDYRCDENSCPNHSRPMRFRKHWWGKKVFASPPVLTTIRFQEENPEPSILSCIYLCSQCGLTKFGLWSQAATGGFYVHKGIVDDEPSQWAAPCETMWFTCDECARKQLEEEVK